MNIVMVLCAVSLMPTLIGTPRIGDVGSRAVPNPMRSNVIDSGSVQYARPSQGVGVF